MVIDWAISTVGINIAAIQSEREIDLGLKCIMCGVSDPAI